jgi:hypothetical protein
LESLSIHAVFISRCWMVKTAGEGLAGAALMVANVAAETQLLLMSFTYTLYEPGTRLLNVGEAWKFVPSRLYTRLAPAGAMTVRLPLVWLHPGLVVCTMGVCGKGFTVTVVVSVLEQPLLSVPVTVYVCVAAGSAITEVPIVADKPVAGLQL